MRQDPARIIKTLQNNNGHIRKTARETGVSPGTVINWRRRAATGSQGGRYLSTRPVRQSTAPRYRRTTTLSAADQTPVFDTATAILVSFRFFIFFWLVKPQLFPLALEYAHKHYMRQSSMYLGL